MIFVMQQELWLRVAGHSYPWKPAVSFSCVSPWTILIFFQLCFLPWKLLSAHISSPGIPGRAQSLHRRQAGMRLVLRCKSSIAYPTRGPTGGSPFVGSVCLMSEQMSLECMNEALHILEYSANPFTIICGHLLYPE